MTLSNDARFWDRSARRYAAAAISDPRGYERTLRRTRELLAENDHVLELGCGTGSTALRLADGVASYLGTDFSPAMIAIAQEKLAAAPVAALSFLAATAEDPALQAGQYDAVLAFNYLHLVRDLPGTLRRIHALLADGGLFISKTGCLGDMNPLIRLALLPAMRAIGKAPYTGAFSASALERQVAAAGFEILATERHADGGSDRRPYMVARKR
jgi:ubiquinone/menaquinone biosynthesis C-methylase UbiE